MEEDCRTVEVFLPSAFTAHEVRHHAYSAIRVIADEAGKFVDLIRIGASRQAASTALRPGLRLLRDLRDRRRGR